MSSTGSPRMDPMPVEASIHVAGHRGMVGSALVRLLKRRGHDRLLTPGRDELDLVDQAQVKRFFEARRPDYVLLAAARVGGIGANNTEPADFIYENLMIQANVIQASYACGVRRLLVLGSSCIYPRMANQPMNEAELLTGPLEPTNEPYAVAKIAGIKLCESYNRQHGTDYRSVMPTNLYGPGDNYHAEKSHVVPGLIRRFHEAKVDGIEVVRVWGSGRALREFLHVDDMASASLHVMELSREAYAEATSPMQSQVNIGSGREVTIRELAERIRGVVGYGGRIEFDSSKPDGAPRKLLDSGLLKSLGWSPERTLEEGLRDAYESFCAGGVRS